MLANQAAAAAAALSRTTVSCHQSVEFMSDRVCVRAFVGPPTEREGERERERERVGIFGSVGLSVGPMLESSTTAAAAAATSRSVTRAIT